MYLFKNNRYSLTEPLNGPSVQVDDADLPLGVSHDHLIWAFLYRTLL